MQFSAPMEAHRPKKTQTCVYGDDMFLSTILLKHDIKPVRKEEGKFYWKIPLSDDDATREK